jgi:hypothetical protein
MFSDKPSRYDLYFKRSLLPSDKSGNIYPLNFQVNYSYKALKMLSSLDLKLLTDRRSRSEVARAVDHFSFFTNNPHAPADFRNVPSHQRDNGGRVIFYARLWNPANHTDPAEKERRQLQNEFRIAACRTIKNNVSNSSAGLFQDDLAVRLAPDMILSNTETSKKSYLSLLNECDICIADDGLKDTPGWKIGEYLMYGKAVITTPINILVEDFTEHHNYFGLSGRTAYQELPEKIESMRENQRYLQMGINNKSWSRKYLEAEGYINRIFTIADINLLPN